MKKKAETDIHFYEFVEMYLYHAKVYVSSQFFLDRQKNSYTYFLVFSVLLSRIKNWYVVKKQTNI